MNKEIRGKGAVGIAIGYYALKGIVSIPLEPSSYNVLFDDGLKINRIKVISCAFKNKRGSFAANIRSMGGNQPIMKVKLFDPSSCDYVFIVTSQLDLYEIPSIKINSTRQITLSEYVEYRVQIIPG